MVSQSDGTSGGECADSRRAVRRTRPAGESGRATSVLGDHDHAVPTQRSDAGINRTGDPGGAPGTSLRRCRITRPCLVSIIGITCGLLPQMGYFRVFAVLLFW